MDTQLKMCLCGGKTKDVIFFITIARIKSMKNFVIQKMILLTHFLTSEVENVLNQICLVIANMLLHFLLMSAATIIIINFYKMGSIIHYIKLSLSLHQSHFPVLYLRLTNLNSFHPYLYVIHLLVLLITSLLLFMLDQIISNALQTHR